ncbi:MAG: inorganic phosphate transporter [Bacteroidales bacterium]|nr:inorganic phosphate transporter [Bacteroidales bacterium]
MSPVFTVIVVILAILAIVDLIVGVSNDAINFLNSSIGSKIASYKTIITVAAVGILVGVLTSHGMMEVARNGVFHPEMFTFTEIMFLYVGVMLTDVLLLDGFNKLGLPTSTTVSMIFELLGAAMAVTVFKLYFGDATGGIEEFVNGGKALGMISAILVSVVLSFVVGSIVMYFSRILFTFRYAKQFGRFGAAWCGIAVVGIIYFAMFKGLKSSGLITEEIAGFINGNILMVLSGLWLASSAVLFVLQKMGVNILKITILSGTFALALAFAGNDLVNFVGVPLAGMDAYALAQDGGTSMMMGELANPKMVNIGFLAIAGVVMAATLFFSKDAKKVSQTELTLASQQEENERFNSTPFSRALVRYSVKLNDLYRRLLPASWQAFINKRFAPISEEERGGRTYDHIRAVVNLAAAAILICIGTSLKLPLSTTYVVFMVSMGSSLADRVWGRDSAVYRISGVMVVIMGWFVTAFIAFLMSFLIVMLLMVGGGYALAGIVLLAGYILLKRFILKDKDADKADEEPLITNDDAPEDVLYNCTQMVVNTMEQTSSIYNRMLVSLFTENRKGLKDMVALSEKMYAEANQRKYEICATVKKLQEQHIETAHYYVQIVDYVCEVSKALLHSTRPAFRHIDNNHRGLSSEQIQDLKLINDKVDDIFSQISQMLAQKDFSQLDEVMHKRDDLFELIASIIKSHIKRVRNDASSSSRASALFLNILTETKVMVLQARNMIKSEAYFLNAIKEMD